MAENRGKNINSEIAIVTDRILKVLNETIDKIEVGLCLPALLDNLNRFVNHITEEELKILTKCEAYLGRSEKEKETCNINEHMKDELVESTFPSDSLEVDLRPKTLEIEAKYFQIEYARPQNNGVEDPVVKMAIYIIWKHSNLVHVAKTEYQKLATGSSGFIFLENMRSLRQCVYNRLMEDLSPEVEKRKNQYYKDVWHKNDEAMTKINTLEPQVNDLKKQAHIEVERKDKLITELQRQLKNIELKFQEEVECICVDSEKNMTVEHKSNEAHQEIILNDIRTLDETYQNTLCGHLGQEKQLRMQRCSIENQLEGCLETYDNDMGVRQAEYEEILAEYKDEEQQLTSLQEKFDEQEMEYIILMEEKAYEEHLELERRIEDLRRRVAARIIQRHWRGLKQRRLERAKSKKARKGKGKKKGGEKPKSPQKS